MSEPGGPGRAVGLLAEVAGRLGGGRVTAAGAAEAAYGADTLGARRALAGAVRVRSVEEVTLVLEAARRHGVPVYPISRGRNWGYGGANPVRDGCVILDLSGMDRILHLDEELGTVTVEPGVTQQALFDHFQARRLPFLVPVHGGGPGCSLVGNALERGYGITPHADHFGAVTSLAAILADGTAYRAALHEAGVPELARLFKWGVGPYLDGLFTQSNLGVVTEMTFALARRPGRIESFYFWVAEDAGLERAVAAVREVLRRYAGVVGSINLMNDRRVLSMTAPYPRDGVPAGGVMSDRQVRELARQYAVPAWMGIGALYGEPAVVRAAKAGVRRLLRTAAGRVVFLTGGRARRLHAALRWLPGAWSRAQQRALAAVMEGQAVFEGVPTEMALRLAYWRTGSPPAADLNPARDGRGLIWYSPLVPMRPATVRAYVEAVRATTPRYGLEPLITLTSLSERCFDSTVPLLFDTANEGAVVQAHAGYAEVVRAGRAVGCFPYRFGIEHMGLAVDREAGFWKVASGLKGAVDPTGILAPGRYVP